MILRPGAGRRRKAWISLSIFPAGVRGLSAAVLLLQLRLKPQAAGDAAATPELLGVLMRGMTFDGERWRLATMGDWQPEGTHLPQPAQAEQLRGICRDLFDLFAGPAATDTAA